VASGVDFGGSSGSDFQPEAPDYAGAGSGGHQTVVNRAKRRLSFPLAHSEYRTEAHADSGVPPAAAVVASVPLPAVLPPCHDLERLEGVVASAPRVGLVAYRGAE
jgi:hypothetical protein